MLSRVSANVICSCSGKVAAVEKRRTISGQLLECVVVENDGQFTPAADYETRRDLSDLTDRDILDAVKAAGIVGLALHKKWLANTYRRFMQRRYVNMEGFRASRNF